MPDEQEEKGFKVVDKRSFEADGAEKEPPSEPADEKKADEAPPKTAQPEKGECSEPAGFPGIGDGPMPEFDFVTFILSLHRSAACHLGHAPDPETRTCQQNLPLPGKCLCKKNT